MIYFFFVFLSCQVTDCCICSSPCCASFVSAPEQVLFCTLWLSAKLVWEKKQTPLGVGRMFEGNLSVTSINIPVHLPKQTRPKTINITQAARSARQRSGWMFCRKWTWLGPWNQADRKTNIYDMTCESVIRLGWVLQLCRINRTQGLNTIIVVCCLRIKTLITKTPVEPPELVGNFSEEVQHRRVIRHFQTA